MDDKDFVFINKPLNEKEEKEFSDFLKHRKSLNQSITKRRKRKLLVKRVSLE
jgi:hypothetical protein